MNVQDLDAMTPLCYVVIGLAKQPKIAEKFMPIIMDLTTPENKNTKDCFDRTVLHYLAQGIAKEPTAAVKNAANHFRYQNITNYL